MHCFRFANVTNNTTIINTFNSDQSNITKIRTQDRQISWQPLQRDFWKLNPCLTVLFISYLKSKLLWSIVRFAPGYSNISKRCLLCLHGKLVIVNYHNAAELLNKRSELMAKYRHGNKFLQSNYKLTIHL